MKANFVLATVGFLFGCVIVGTSLVHASEVYSADKISSTPQQVAVHEPILPGHVLYPATVLSHKLKVLVSSPEDKPFRELAISRQRLKDSVQLIEMDKNGLATQTLWKGHHYIALVISHYPTDSMNEHLRQEVLVVLTEYQDVLLEYKNFFSDNQKSVLDQLLAENEVLIKQLAL